MSGYREAAMIEADLMRVSGSDPDARKDEFLRELSDISFGPGVVIGAGPPRPTVESLRRAYVDDRIDIETFEFEVERVLREEDRP